MGGALQFRLLMPLVVIDPPWMGCWHFWARIQSEGGVRHTWLFPVAPLPWDSVAGTWEQSPCPQRGFEESPPRTKARWAPPPEELVSPHPSPVCWPSTSSFSLVCWVGGHLGHLECFHYLFLPGGGGLSKVSQVGDLCKQGTVYVSHLYPPHTHRGRVGGCSRLCPWPLGQAWPLAVSH